VQGRPLQMRGWTVELDFVDSPTHEDLINIASASALTVRDSIVLIAKRLTQQINQELKEISERLQTVSRHSEFF